MRVHGPGNGMATMNCIVRDLLCYLPCRPVNSNLGRGCWTIPCKACEEAFLPYLPTFSFLPGSHVRQAAPQMPVWWLREACALDKSSMYACLSSSHRHIERFLQALLAPAHLLLLMHPGHRPGPTTVETGAGLHPPALAPICLWLASISSPMSGCCSPSPAILCVSSCCLWSAALVPCLRLFPLMAVRVLGPAGE